MNEDEIDLLLEQMTIKNTDEIRESALSKLLQIDDSQIPLLIKNSGKAKWERAIKVIKQMGSQRSLYAIDRLIWLLKDLSWPGAEDALKILGNFEVATLVPHIELALIRAKDEEDYIWIAAIELLVNKLKITESDFKQKSVYKILELAEW